MTDKRALVLGCGYVGLVLARELWEQGFEVIGTTRTPERFREIEATGASPALVDVTDPATLRPLLDFQADQVFDLVPPQRIDDARYTAWGTRNVASAFVGRPLESLVYLSSTSVYGRRSGEWTDEATQTRPISPVGQARLECETIYLDAFQHDAVPARICRVPGIYGPGRTLRQRLETGAYRRMDDEKLWVSRIHVEDLAAGLIAAASCGKPGEIYLLCDDEPTTGQEYAELTASLLSLPMPPTVSREDIRQELSQDGFERRISSRRCRNRRMREELGVQLRYPTVREGVPAALEAEGAL
ncbi:MAG: NAD-dependent epimerase/dehydratase family protein [Gemmatimonadota bacterium]